jgi:4-alpha-glucanotransferase
MSNKLDRLSELAGIHSGYYDIWGKRHEVTEATRIALLKSTGSLGQNSDDLDAATHLLEHAQWQEILPPVHVTRVSQPLAIPLHLPESDAELELNWRITLEAGQTLNGSFRPAQLERTSTHFDEVALIAVTLVLPTIEESGYHSLELSRGDTTLAACKLIACPATTYLPASFADDSRVWGLAVQLYSLRSERNWGLGDFTDLGRAIDWASASGASLVGVNPLHALFPHNPSHCSPYSPSSRQFLNVLHIDVESVPEFGECAAARERAAEPDFQARLENLRLAELIDYAGVTEAKFEILALLYQHFREHHLSRDSLRAQEFRGYLAQGGQELYLFALYHALQDHFHAQDNDLWGWPVWPEAYQREESAEVATFAKQHDAAVEWHVWLQWLADAQLADAAQKAEQNGMSIGLYQDLAVGVDKGGAEVWKHRDLYALDCRIGCPPDDFNLLGQDWGLPPLIPGKLRAAAYAPFIAMLRANMKHAGALRIDHVMGLMRLYWIPPDLKGDAGAYFAYPFEDLTGILALESHRNRCLVVGEDLGTVPEEVRHALGEMGVLTYRLFYFERQQDGHFMPPGWYPRQALVSASTHDLPTLAGYWKGRDIEVRTELHQFPSEAVRHAQIEGRRLDKARLLQDLAREGLLPKNTSQNPDEVLELSPELCRAILRYIGRSPAFIALVQAEDMLSELNQANLPGTVDEHPNWRRKLALELSKWDSDENCRAIGATMASER